MTGWKICWRRCNVRDVAASAEQKRSRAIRGLCLLKSWLVLSQQLFDVGFDITFVDDADIGGCDLSGLIDQVGGWIGSKAVVADHGVISHQNRIVQAVAGDEWVNAPPGFVGALQPFVRYIRRDSYGGETALAVRPLKFDEGRDLENAASA